MGRRNVRRSSGPGCSTLLWIIVIIAVIGYFAPFFGNSSPSPVSSSISREKLSPSLCLTSSEWYEDGWGDWIDNAGSSEQQKLVDDMQTFYSLTGVQPYLYITGSEGASISDTNDLENAARDFYDSHFQDKGHLLLIFREYPNASGNYLSGVFVGEDAKRVIDDEAREVLLSKIDRYYDDTSLSEARLFGKAFSETARSIMRKSSGKTSYSAVFVGPVILVVAVFLFLVFRKRKANTVQQTPSVTQAAAASPQSVSPPVPGPDGSAGKTIVMKCPNCGASVSVSPSGGTCRYCSSPLHP